MTFIVQKYYRQLVAVYQCVTFNAYLNMSSKLFSLSYFVSCLIGELLGIEYLYSQTGTSLTPALQDPEVEDRMVEQVNDEDVVDEGFEEPEDITVPVLTEEDPCRDIGSQAPSPQGPSPPPLPQSALRRPAAAAAAAMPSTQGKGRRAAAAAAAAAAMPSTQGEGRRAAAAAAMPSTQGEGRRAADAATSAAAATSGARVRH